MKKTTLGILLLLSFASIPLMAQSTVGFSAGVGERDVLDINNQPLADGNTVSIGFFDPGFDVASFVSDLNALDAAWNEFSTTSIQIIFNEPGRFAGSASTFDPVFDDQDIYMLIYQTADNGTPDPTFSNVMGYGLYTSSLPSWTFPIQGGLPDASTTSINSSQVNAAMFGAFDANHLMLMPIPEPGTSSLALLGIGSMLLYLRMRKR